MTPMGIADTPGMSRTSKDRRMTEQAAPGQDRTGCVGVRARASCRAVSQSAITAAHHPRQTKNRGANSAARRGCSPQNMDLFSEVVF